MNTGIVIVLVWLGWGVVHSVLASRRVRAVVQPALGCTDTTWRRLYNVVALVTLAAPLAVLWLAPPLPSLLHFSGPFAVLPWIARGIAVLVFVDTLGAYSARSFLGVIPDAGDGLRFARSHCFVRHPWYFAILLLVWVRDLDVAGLATAVAISIYLLIGASFEERRLREQHPEVWPRYGTRVAMLLPLPWRTMRTAELRVLQSHQS